MLLGKESGAPSIPGVKPDAYIPRWSLPDLRLPLQVLPGRRSPCLVLRRLLVAFRGMPGFPGFGIA